MEGGVADTNLVERMRCAMTAGRKLEDANTPPR